MEAVDNQRPECVPPAEEPIKTEAAVEASMKSDESPEVAADDSENAPVVVDAKEEVAQQEEGKAMVTEVATVAVTEVTTEMTVETTTETVEATVEAVTESMVAAVESTEEASVVADDAPLDLADLVLEADESAAAANGAGAAKDAEKEEAIATTHNEPLLKDEDSDEDEEDDSLEHELQDFYAEKHNGSAHEKHASVPTTITYSVNEMEVITSRGGRSGSLSKFLDDSDTYRRRSLPAYPDDPLFGASLHHKSMSLAAFLDMGIDPILEILEDTDSDIRLWLMQPQIVKAVLNEFITPPVFSGEPHEEYGYYKKHFICSEIIMKLYTGEEDLYESFSSDSSSGSTATNAVFGCQDAVDIEKWEQLYSIFNNPLPLDEMQLLFFSKALVRLHDGFCLEEGYVSNVLRRFLPMVVPHLYSNTIKYMLTLILQSYESVHPITGRNDAMEIVAPLLAQATKLTLAEPQNQVLVENTSHLLVDMLQANQADRLGSFCRREGGVYLSKYFVRDQFGTIRGFESMTHGYHNFLQYMLLEELGKHPKIVEELFRNAYEELATVRETKLSEASSSVNVHIATELLLLCGKYYNDSVDEDGDNNQVEDTQKYRNSFGYGNFSADQFSSSPRGSATETSMYNLSSLSHGNALWSNVLSVARGTAKEFVANFNKGLIPSLEISLAKYLHALVTLNDEEVNDQLHESKLIPTYLRILEKRSKFDMLLIHVVPAISFILRDADATRAKNCPLTKDLFGTDGDDKTIIDLLLLAKSDIPTLHIYSAIIHDVIDEVFASNSPSQNNAQVLFHCKRSSSWSKLTGRTSSKSDAKRMSDVKRSSDEGVVNNRRSSLKEKETKTPSPKPSVPLAPVADPADDEQITANGDKQASPLSEPEKAQSPVIPPPPPAPEATDRSSESSTKSDKSSPKDSEKDTTRKSHYFKNVLQSPVFKSPMRLGSVIKIPEKVPSPPQQNGGEQSASSQANQQRGSFQWNNVFKKLRNSWVANHHHDKSEKKLLALSNEPFAQPMAPRQTDVLVVDTSRGDDVTKLVHHDSGVVVVDVPASTAHHSGPSSDRAGLMNVITSGYMYKNKLPETGQRHVWERYYFVLNRLEGSLSYYISEAHAKDRTYVRGTARPVSISEGIPVHVSGHHSVYGFQINTQGHGAFMVLVDSIDTRLVWLTEILVCVNASNPPQPSSSKRLSLLSNDDASKLYNSGSSVSSQLRWSKQEMKGLVVDFYKNLFGPNLKFSTPLEAPASFWMEEKIDPVAESCVLSSNLPDSVPYWGEFHGYKRLCDYWKIRDETVERSGGRVLRIVIDEDEETAVVMTSTTFRILRNSQIVTEESCDILSMSGGSIVSIHCTFDSYRIAEAFRKSANVCVLLERPSVDDSSEIAQVHGMNRSSPPVLDEQASVAGTVSEKTRLLECLPPISLGPQSLPQSPTSPQAKRSHRQPAHYSSPHAEMSELQLIVEQLNGEPFRLGLTLVAFDEKSNFELLQILNEVFTEIDTKHNVDLRNEADEQRAYRYLEFLQLLKFPLPRDIDNFRDALIHGDRQVLYPILYWALKNLPGHKKRAYLGKYLTPLNVPQEYFGNETLNGMYEHYKQLQEQFKGVHKEVDALRNSKTRPGELRKEITQLEEESHQLQGKIANLKKKTASESGFKDILEATSALRKEQEEQAKLAERKRDQVMSLTLVEKRLRECEQRLMDLRSSLSHDTPPDQLFEHLKNQVERNRDILMIKFPQEFKLQQENLQHMEDEIASLKSSIQHFQAQIAEAHKNTGDDKLGIYRQHASVQMKRLATKEDELDALRTEKVKMQKQIEDLEAKMSELSGSKFMSREEFKQYANSLRNKTNQYKKVKVELAELTAESVVLHRTEQLLKSKDADLDGFLKDMEAKKGVTGFLDTQEKLDNISEMNAQVNKMKGETLEEISRIVTDINQTLKERKNQLAPQIKELRAVRQRYQEMEQTYLEKKVQYDNTAVGLETERIKLEQECNAFQEDCLREESQYHLLHCMLQIERGKADKIEQEVEYEKGSGRLLRDIKSFQELYKHKVAQQESLTKELRKQQKTLKANTTDHNAQREQFENLFKLLSCKVKLAGKAASDASRQGQEPFNGHADITQFENVGGANVMTLDA